MTRFPAGSRKITDRFPQGWVVGGITQSSQPELADRAQAAPFVRTAFNPVMRATLPMLGIRQFLLLTLDDRREA